MYHAHNWILSFPHLLFVGLQQNFGPDRCYPKQSKQLPTVRLTTTLCRDLGLETETRNEDSQSHKPQKDPLSHHLSVGETKCLSLGSHYGNHLISLTKDTKNR